MGERLIHFVGGASERKPEHGIERWVAFLRKPDAAR
jgi:hypothetical protein